MQDKELNERKEILKKAAGRVIRSFRDKGINIFYYERDISSTTILPIEKGQSDMKLTTFYRLAEAFGLKLSELAKLIEDELPEGFTMSDPED